MSNAELVEIYLGHPVFLWEAFFNFVSVLLAGLILAFVTTFYLKRKDERTRVAGVILEKRVEAQQEILQLVESNTQNWSCVSQQQKSSVKLYSVLIYSQAYKGIEIAKQDAINYYMKLPITL